MSSYYHYGGASTYSGASTSTSWNSGSISYETRPIAKIIDTTPPSNTWDDVTRVNVDGTYYAINSLVLIKDEDSVARILHFRESSLKVVLLGQPDSKMKSITYSAIEILGEDKAKTVQLDPNTAFKYRKKKEGKY